MLVTRDLYDLGGSFRGRWQAPHVAPKFASGAQCPRCSDFCWVLNGYVVSCLDDFYLCRSLTLSVRIE